jgi:hypothetical protein
MFLGFGVSALKDKPADNAKTFSYATASVDQFLDNYGIPLRDIRNTK